MAPADTLVGAFRGPLSMVVAWFWESACVEFQPPAELEKLGSFGEVVSWAISAWSPSDGPRSMRELAEAGLVRESGTVATGDGDIAANNHAKWYVLLGQYDLPDFGELKARRDRSWRSAETEASKVTRRWFEEPGAGMEKVGYLARGLLLPAEVAGWISDRRRALSKSASPYRSAAVLTAVEATRGLVRDYRVFDRWLSELGATLTAPAPWQPNWTRDIPRLSLPPLPRQPVTVVSGDMGSGKSRYIRQELARLAQNARNARDGRPTVPLILGAEHLPAVAADPDPWSCAVRAFVTDHSASLTVAERDRLAGLLLSRSRNGDVGVVVACDGLDELPHTTLLRLLDQASGPVTRFLRAEGASVVLGVRSATDAERIVSAFADATDGTGKPVRVGALTREELATLAEAWHNPLSSHRLDEFLARHPTALLAACGLATGAAERNDSELLQSVVRRLLAGEWKTAAEVSPVRLDAALAAAAEVAFTMAGDQAEWRYSTAAAWARRAVTEAAGDDILEAVGRLLPRLLQRHAHEVTWVHAAVQEFLVGYHLSNGLPQAAALEFLRRRWWQHAQWRRVAVHAVACAHDPVPFLGLLAEEARADPFAVLDGLLLRCSKVAPVPASARTGAFSRLRPVAKAMVPVLRSGSWHSHSPPDGLAWAPELLRSLGADAFDGFGPADFLHRYRDSGGQVKCSPSPFLLPAIQAGAPAALQLFRRSVGLLSPAVSMTGWNVPEAVAAAVPWIDTTELLVLNELVMSHPPWIYHEHWWAQCQVAIATELWARNLKASAPRLAQAADLGLLMANLGPAATAALLSVPCLAVIPRCGQDRLADYADKVIARSRTSHLVTLLREPSTSPSVRVAAVLQLAKRGEPLDQAAVLREDVARALAHQCPLVESSGQATDLLDALLDDVRFPWAEEVLAGAGTVSAVLAPARHGRQNSARKVFNQVLAGSSEYGLSLLPLLEAGLDLTEPEIVGILQRTHHSGDPADEAEDALIYRALLRLGPEARRAVWDYAAPGGNVRMYVESGYVIQSRMLHEVMTLDELVDAARSARTMEKTTRFLRAALRLSPAAARSLAAEIADKNWEEHLAKCNEQMSCRLFAGLSELFPSAIREQVSIHAEGLKLIEAGRYDLVQEWRPARNPFFKGHLQYQYWPVAKALAAAADRDAAALEVLKSLALVNDEYERALAEVNPVAGRSVMESRVLANAVEMDVNRAAAMLRVGSPLAIDWYVRSIASSGGSVPWFGGNAEVALAFLRRLLQEWVSRTDTEPRVRLAVKIFETWDRWAESFADEETLDIRKTLALHADGIAASLVGRAPALPDPD